MSSNFIQETYMTHSYAAVDVMERMRLVFLS